MPYNRKNELKDAKKKNNSAELRGTAEPGNVFVTLDPFIHDIIVNIKILT